MQTEVQEEIKALEQPLENGHTEPAPAPVESLVNIPSVPQPQAEVKSVPEQPQIEPQTEPIQSETVEQQSHASLPENEQVQPEIEPPVQAEVDPPVQSEVFVAEKQEETVVADVRFKINKAFESTFFVLWWHFLAKLF